MFKSSKSKDPCSKETMTVLTKEILKNKVKSIQDKNGPEINGTVMSATSEFPIKPFQGTKTYLESIKERETDLKLRKKRKANLSDEIHLKIKKQTKYDPSKVMHKLEQFSDIWNDCPDVENPKSSFEVVPNNKTEVGTSSNKNIDRRTKSSQTINISGKAQNLAQINNWDSNDDDQSNSYKYKSKLEVTKNVVNRSKEQFSDVSQTGKYDSKLAEMKRKKAVEEQNQLHTDQKNIIKKALSTMDSKLQVNKKIVFGGEEDNEEYQSEVNLKSDQTKNQKLFQDDDSSDGDFELKVNSQFEGKKGQKLLELQSKFASDSRFTLDSRFQDSESENEKDEAPAESLDIQEEKRRQLEILESIVKQPIRPLSEKRKLSGKKFDDSLMVRFDPTKKDHEKYLIKPQKQQKEEEPTEGKKIKKKSNKEKHSLPNSEESKPKVSSEKIYAVKDDLKEVLRKENKTEFSLLNLFGSKDGDSTTQQGGSESVKKLKYATKNPFRYDSSESEEEESKSEQRGKEKVTAKPSLPSWRTTFFFTENDSRLKEAEEFLKGPEDQEGDEEFAEKRKMLKDFIRHKLKNSNRKKDPFKKKLGGVKKKVFHKKKGK